MKSWGLEKGGENGLGARGKRRVVVVDDHPIIRRGLAELISQQPDLVVCTQAQNAAEALCGIAENEPDLLIVDIALDEASGIDLTREVRRRHPDLAILVLSMHEETLYADRALRAGANGYVAKADAPETLLKAIREVLHGELYVSERMAGRLLKGLLSRTGESSCCDGMSSLSDREMEVFEQIGKGLNTRDIAVKLCLSAKTVETHRSHIKNKLHLKNSAELTRYAVNWGNGNEGAERSSRRGP